MRRAILGSGLLALCALWVAAGESDPAPKPQPQKGTKEAYFSASRTGNEKSNELVKTGQFYFPRLQFQCHEDVPDKWDVHPIGDQKLREQIRKLTNINILTDPVVVNLDKPEELCRYPYVFMTSEGTFDFSDSNLKVLREYLLRGGFVLADDCVLNQKGDLFYRSFVQQANRLFPDNPMRPIPLDHEIFNCFFKLEQGAPHLQGVKHPAMGLFEKDTGRLMCVVTSGDIHCGWVGFSSFSQKGIRESIEMGVNVVVYCLTH